MAKSYEFTKKNRQTRQNDIVGKMVIDKFDDGTAKLLFYGDICNSTWDEWTFEDKAPQDVVEFLSELNGTEKIEVHINSGGGDVFGGIAIYNILKRYTGDKICYIDGIAASIASVIMFACDRIICPSGAQIMIHKPWSYCQGDSEDMLKAAEALDNCQKAITAIYVEHAKVDESKITELINAETWFTGESAAEIFDIEVDETVAPAACAKSDYFDKYNNAPEDILKEPSADGNNTEKERLQIELDLLKM